MFFAVFVRYDFIIYIQLIKYSNLLIKYPIFTLSKKPFDINYTSYQIKIKKTESSSWETVDDRTYGGDYFTRLLQLEYRVAYWVESPEHIIQTEYVNSKI